ncbi:hypothetical protein O181_057245 [Austropuccinia psidii MF-1]|uniref:Uncharacterized protein n=1 Tax=Austropuccinia psidii MF-1 TaxID=1389203 RepID=A0A9Q3E7K6_9BASI|nr:hypothetical protein [Austropuccinia psidii MF-1]
MKSSTSLFKRFYHLQSKPHSNQSYSHSRSQNQNQNQHRLFKKVRNLLKINQVNSALNLFLNHHQSKINLKSDHSFKIANLFRSFNQPQASLLALNKINSSSIKTKISKIQTLENLIFNNPSNHSINQNFNLHAQLAHDFTNLTNQLTSQNLQNSSNSNTNLSNDPQNSKTLQVILSLILKLGDLNWILSIFQDFFPDYTQLLFHHLNSSSSNLNQLINLNSSQIPSGRLIKFLVNGFTLSGDLTKAFIVVRFHQKVLEKSSSNHLLNNDFSPELALIRALSRSHVNFTKKRKKILIILLEKFKSNHLLLDTYTIDTLLDMRYRLRWDWSLSQTHSSTFRIIKIILERHLNLFLLHWRRKKIIPENISENHLIHSSLQTPHLISTWKFRPSARTFTILILSLKAHLRHQTRPILSLSTSFNSSPHNLNDLQQLQPRKRRPSPGSHRTILAQLLAFERLNQSACQIQCHQSSLAILPLHFQLLTHKNIILLLEIFLIAKDYAGAIVLLRQIKLFSDEIIELVISTFSNQLLSNKNQNVNISLLLKSLKIQNFQGSTLNLVEGLKEIISGLEKEDCLKKLESLLRACEFNQSDQWFAHEIDLVVKRIDQETLKVNTLANQSSFSEFTLQFLRNQIAHQQLNYISYGLMI